MARRSPIQLESLTTEQPDQAASARPGPRRRTSEQARIADAAIAQIDELSKLATLGEVTALLAHELNNLLTPLLAYAQAGLESRNDEAFREKALSKCLIHAEQATRVSQAILGLAKHQSVAGRREGATASCRVSVAVEAALASFARDLSKDGIELELDWKDEIDVAMDQAELQQVLMNLILNARRALLDSPQRKLTIKARRKLKTSEGDGSGGDRNLTYSEQTAERAWVVIKVSDTGPGMSIGGLLAAMGPRAYVRRRDTERGLCEVALRSAWTRGRWGRSREGEPEVGGGGLGLVLCRRLVEATGGTLWATSAVPGGTTVAAIVPAA
jgi:signal transduction histidine kinase